MAMLRLMALLALAIPPRACPQEGFAQAKALIEAVSASMRDAPALAFESELLTKIETIQVKQKAKTVLQRPNLARLELSGAGQDALIVLDGRTSWHYVKAKNGYSQAAQSGTFKLAQYGAGPAAALFFDGGTGSLAPYLSDATVTKEKLGDDACSVVAWKVGQEASRLWIVGDRLRRFTTVRTLDGKAIEQTVDYGAFDLRPSVAPGAFAFTPPPGARTLGAGDESKLLAVGASAPDFAATYVDGKPAKLSDFKGRPVLVVFWFYGCATCRQEFPRLQPLVTEYGKRGLAALAVNFGDKPETVAAYFEKEKIALVPLLQRQDEVARAFCVRTYPVSYLIGADGKVAWRMAGLDETALKAKLEEIAPAK